MKLGAPEHLSWPWALIPFGLALILLLKGRMRRLRLLAEPEALEVLSQTAKQRHVRRALVLRSLALFALVLAAVRPQWGFHWEDARRRGLDILVLLDTSNSMRAQDLKPDRLQQAKWAVRDLATRLNGDRVGLIAFAGSAFLQCPLTSDYAAFLLTLDDLYPGIIPRGGTAIKKAMETALESFEDHVDTDQVIILISDGEDHESDPLALVPELKKKGIRVFSVGVGSLEGELIPATEGPGFLKDRQGKTVKTVLNENMLKQLALQTGGAYVRAAPGDFGLERIVDENLQQLKRGEFESKRVKVHEERFQWVLGVALALLFIEAGLSRTNRRASA